MVVKRKREPWRLAIAERCVEAHLRYQQSVLRHVTRTELAERMSEVAGQRFEPTQVSSYQNAGVTPPYPVLLAYAKACLVDPGWLAFGNESLAPKPEAVPTHAGMPMPATTRHVIELPADPVPRTVRRKRAG